METRLLIVFSIFILGNLYWGYRYLRIYRQQQIPKQLREEALDEIQDHWIQFSCIAVIIVLLIAPIANDLALR